MTTATDTAITVHTSGDWTVELRHEGERTASGQLIARSAIARLPRFMKEAHLLEAQDELEAALDAHGVVLTATRYGATSRYFHFF